ncbi:MAG: protein translocase subunit SecD [Planctomycetes bacterium]|nr:protein translocase subunit SecD [Planctomycetota bacterium]
MRTSGLKLTRTWLIGSLVLAGMIGLSATSVWSQDAATEPAPATAAAESDTAAEDSVAPADAASPVATTSDDAAPAADSSADPPATETSAPGSSAASEEQATKSEEGASTEDKDATTPGLSLPAGTTEPSIASEVIGPKGETELDEAGTGWRTFGLAVGLAALFILPILLGNYLARVWKMPDHAWKFGLVLLSLAVSIVVCLFGQFKFGPDLAGGITLVYELADAQMQPAAEPAPPGAAPDEEMQIRSGGREFQLSDLIGVLKRRLDPDGTKEITIRKYGPAVEIIIPQTGEDEMAFVKRRITDMGTLEFRITADPAVKKDQPFIERAMRLPPSQKFLTDGKGNKEAEWVAYDIVEFGPVDEPGRVVKRLAGDTPEALVLIDPMNVTGENLTSSIKGLDDRGGPAVHFAFDREGARRFGQLTGQNLPNLATQNARRNLGIILDKRLISAPSIESRITDRGMISGGSMTDKEVEHVVEILKAGSLPVALNKEPISQWTISPTLGGETVEKGKVAILVSLAAVVLFMIVYYRFAGVVACLALTFNLLLVLALMVLIRAAFTLPGLAGLVLTIGMAVDANVLIYERIREELRSGAALRMAIRNGFSRAMNAIIDSNVTTIIAGVALYYIGTDQVKGFAVTLILGILTSMFSAIFFARVVFDVAERRGWITQLRMMKLMETPNYDFLRVRWIAGGASLVLIAIGMIAVYSRGQQMLDIDFTGGSSVTFTLNADDRMSLPEVRDALMQTELADKNLVIVELGTDKSRYTVDSRESIDAVKKIVAEKFGTKLKTFSLDYRDLKPYTEGEFTGTEATLLVNSGSGYTSKDGMSYDAIQDLLQQALRESGHEGIRPTLTNPNYRPGSGARFQEWNMRLVGLDPAATGKVLDRMQAEMASAPLFPMANNIGGRVSSDMQTRALLAIVVSLIGVIGYLWLRFQNVTYGLAAGTALVHDVLVTIGMMAISAYVVRAVPGLASVLQLDAFQINLTIVAALLTIIGYSLNDTIVTFDRLREIKGKSPHLTPEMVNSSVNQTLSRTILTATTVFLVVVILYFFGGEGIHSFAFAFLIGVIAGTYSTVYIAAPVLLWLDGLWRRYFSGVASTVPAKTQRARLSEATR